MADPAENWRSPILWPPKKWRFNRPLQLFSDAVITTLIAGALVALVATLIALFVIPYQAIGALKDGQHEAARNYLLALGALFGVPFLIWRTMIAANQTAVSRESLYTQLFASGVERLGAEKVSKIVDAKPIFQRDGLDWKRDSSGLPIPETDHKGMPIIEVKTIERTDINIEVRLGAVYALERVALDSSRDKLSIMRTLAAYIKNTIRNVDGEVAIDINKRPDIIAAINVLGRFPVYSKDEFSYDISGIDLKNVILRNISLECCDFSNSVSESMYFRNVSLEEAGLHYVKWKTFTGRGCNLNGTNIFKAAMDNLNLENCSFNNAQINHLIADRIGFSNVDLRKTSFYECTVKNFHSVSSNLFECNFFETDLSNSVFRRTSIIDSIFEKCTFLFSELETAVGHNVVFRKCNMTGAKLNESLKFNPADNFIASDELFDDLRRRGASYELASLIIEEEYRKWLGERDAT